jgi:hypothetical protein
VTDGTLRNAPETGLSNTGVNYEALQQMKDGLDAPKTAGFCEAPAAFKNELDLLDRYQAFSSEMLRVALLGLTALGALVFALFPSKLEQGKAQIQISLEAKWFLIASALFFGLSSAFSLLHRYCSVDSMANHLKALRLDMLKKNASEPRKARNFMFWLSSCSLFLAASALALSGLAFVVAIAIVILK